MYFWRMALIWSVFMAETTGLALWLAWDAAIFIAVPIASVAAIALHRKSLVSVCVYGTLWFMASAATDSILLHDEPFAMFCMSALAVPVFRTFLPTVVGLVDPRACQACGYSLVGLVGTPCPECGNQQPRATFQELSQPDESRV
jgi:hypothetical protein